MVVHTVLPDGCTRAVAGVLRPAGIAHVAHAHVDPVGVAGVVARDDAAHHLGTVLRMVARDTIVARRLAVDVRARGDRAFVVAGEHDYGRQIDGQLRLAGLPRTDDPDRADVLVVAGLAGEPEVERIAALRPPVIAFDGIQGADLGRGRDVRVVLPFAAELEAEGRIRLEAYGERAARLVVAALQAGATDRRKLLDALRRLGPFDAHGDPVDPPVWLWRADGDWRLSPERPL